MESIEAVFSREQIPVGKIAPDLLARLLGMPRLNSVDLVVPPMPGEDAAVVRIGQELVAVGADPITFRTPRPGFYAVHVNANDIAVMGAKPTFFTLTLLFPPSSTETDVAEVMRGALEAADALGIVLIGGHTEVTEAVTTPLVSVTMFGSLLSQQPVRTGDGRAGDAVIQVNPLGLEGTSILVAQNRTKLQDSLGSDTLDTALLFSECPGLSVVAPSMYVAASFGVHAMHDPTEGGIATGLYEIAVASNTGVRVYERALLIRQETATICRLLGMDPLGLISSGCLLLTVPMEDSGGVVSGLAARGFEAACIGSLCCPEDGYVIVSRDGESRELPRFRVDELARRKA